MNKEKRSWRKIAACGLVLSLQNFAQNEKLSKSMFFLMCLIVSKGLGAPELNV